MRKVHRGPGHRDVLLFGLCLGKVTRVRGGAQAHSDSGGLFVRASNRSDSGVFANSLTAASSGRRQAWGAGRWGVKGKHRISLLGMQPSAHRVGGCLSHQHMAATDPLRSGRAQSTLGRTDHRAQLSLIQRPMISESGVVQWEGNTKTGWCFGDLEL